MKRIFISQPMRDKSVEEIRAERTKIIELIKDSINEEFEVLDTIFMAEPNKTFAHAPLYYLGKSIQLLGCADYIYFANDWKNYNGCCIEYEVAKRYNIQIINE